jgi:hypothetical protein
LYNDGDEVARLHLELEIAGFVSSEQWSIAARCGDHHEEPLGGSLRYQRRSIGRRLRSTLTVIGITRSLAAQ